MNLSITDVTLSPGIIKGEVPQDDPVTIIIMILTQENCQSKGLVPLSLGSSSSAVSLAQNTQPTAN
jgi:hypothetical protein